MISLEDYLALKTISRAEPLTGPLDERQQHLTDLGYIEATDYACSEEYGAFQLYPTGWRLSITGRDAISAYERDRQERAEQETKEAKRQSAQDAKAAQDLKKKFRHDYAVAAFSAVSGAFVTLVLEYICGHAGIFEEFFRFLLGR